MDENSDTLPETNTIPLRKRASERTPEEGHSRFDRIALRLFGGFFQQRREQFGGLQQTLNQARVSDGYVLYLSRAVLWFSILLGSALFFAGLVTAAMFGLLPNISTIAGLIPFDSPVSLPFSFELSEGGRPVVIPPETWESIIGAGPIAIGFLLTMLLSLIIAVIPTTVMYFKPWFVAGEREREIDTMLPYTVTFMYALSRGGANLINVLRTVSNSEDVYGEAAVEFRTIVRDMEFFDSDLRMALRQAAETSPSDSFEAFIDDLISIVDTGGDLEDFLYDKTEEYLQDARREQENFLETLALMGEIYVTAFVAGPLFVIIIVTVMALIGGSSLFMLYAIVYGILPLGNIGFAFFVDIMKSSKTADSRVEDYGKDLPIEDLEERVDGDDEEVDERVKNLYETKKGKLQKEIFLHPLSTFRDNPVYTLAVSVPFMFLYVILAYAFYGIPEINSMAANAVDLTTVYFVVPMMILLTPISIFHEIRIRRQQRMLDKLPAMLKRLSSANATGMSLSKSFDIVAESTGGELGDELRNVKREIDWRHDLNEALSRFSRRLGTSRMSRVVKLITMANRATGNVTDVLDVATKDVSQIHRLEKDRKQEMAMYTVIIIVSFLVYLLVIVMLNEAFLSRIAEMSAEGAQAAQDVEGAGQGTGGGGGMGFSLSEMPVDLYNALFYHSTIVQALGAGLIAGQMGSDDMLSGLKYSLAMVAIASITFLVI